jgi:hypothetical protein
VLAASVPSVELLEWVACRFEFFQFEIQNVKTFSPSVAQKTLWSDWVTLTRIKQAQVQLFRNILFWLIRDAAIIKA